MWLYGSFTVAWGYFFLGNIVRIVMIDGGFVWLAGKTYLTVKNIDFLLSMKT